MTGKSRKSPRLLADTKGAFGQPTPAEPPAVHKSSDGHTQIDVLVTVLLENGFAGRLMINQWEIPDVYFACRNGLKAICKAVK